MNDQISPLTAFAFDFFLIYGAISFADDIVDRLRSRRATKTGEEIDAYIKNLANKWKKEPKQKAKKKTKKS